MLVHDRFVFIHNQKCGGIFVRHTLKRELGSKALSASLPSIHAGWSEIPSSAAGRPVLCFVRNPWDWYVSWYEFKRQRPASRGPAFNELSNDCKHDFAQTVRNACAWRHPAAGDADLCTASFIHSAGPGLSSGELTVGRFESLIDDLERFLSDAGVELPAGAVARAHKAKAVNSTKRRPYQEYYDDELRELVGDSCRMLVDRFGYRFETATDTLPQDHGSGSFPAGTGAARESSSA